MGLGAELGQSGENPRQVGFEPTLEFVAEESRALSVDVPQKLMVVRVTRPFRPGLDGAI
jgi:hypothetical protein